MSNIGEYTFMDNKSIICSTGEVKKDKLYDFLTEKIENKVFPKKTKFYTFAGVHGTNEGKLGKAAPPNPHKTVIYQVLQNLKIIIKEMQYVFGEVKSIGKN